MERQIVQIPTDKIKKVGSGPASGAYMHTSTTGRSVPSLSLSPPRVCLAMHRRADATTRLDNSLVCLLPFGVRVGRGDSGGKSKAPAHRGFSKNLRGSAKFGVWGKKHPERPTHTRVAGGNKQHQSERANGPFRHVMCGRSVCWSTVTSPPSRLARSSTRICAVSHRE